MSAFQFAAQLTPPSSASPPTPLQVHANQLHVPGLVLLGDAAHAVSPATSNGMNSALEVCLIMLFSVCERRSGGDAVTPGAGCPK